MEHMLKCNLCFDVKKPREQPEWSPCMFFSIQVQKVCDATLDIIAQIDDRWAERVQREKFQVNDRFNLNLFKNIYIKRSNSVGPPCI